MPVITRRQLRSLSHPNAVSEGGPSEDTLPRTMQESDVDDDPMDGSFAVLSSSKEDEEQESVWDEPEFDASEDESDHEEIDHPDVDDDYEGDFHIIDGLYAMQTAYTATRPMAKRIKLGKVGRASSSKSESPAKPERTRVNRRVQGRLQNMLSLSFDVLFLVCPCRPNPVTICC
jgi:hypothetical protein